MFKKKKELKILQQHYILQRQYNVNRKKILIYSEILMSF